MNIGIYEKGPYIGLFSNLNQNTQLELGINYLDINIGDYDAGFSNNIESKISFKGFKLMYRKFIKDLEFKSGPFLQVGLELNKIKAYSNVELSKMTYENKNLSVRCPSCGDLALSIEPDKLRLIPSLNIGWQHFIRKNTTLMASLGIQYIPRLQTKWGYQRGKQTPFFVREEVSNSISKIDKQLENLPNIFPSAMISISYYFK